MLQNLARLITWCAAQGSVGQVLTELVHFIENLEPGVRASVLLVDRTHGVLRLAAAPSLPPAYNAAIDGLEYGEGVGSCGSAVARLARVVVTDIAADPLWDRYRHLALPHGLCACWSAPFFDSRENLLGTFAMYYSESRGPTDAESSVIDLAASVAGVLVERHNDTERLREREARLHAIVENEPASVHLLDLEGRLVQMNPAGLQLMESDWSTLAGRALVSRVADEHRSQVTALLARIANGDTGSLEFDVIGGRGTRRTLEMHAVPIRDARGVVTSLLGIARDVTARRRAEAALLESKNLESIGRLAGGVAHDFNNMLSAILGFTELALYSVPADSVIRDHLFEVQQAARRAANLTRQLLAVARRETSQPRVLDLNLAVAGLVDIMRRPLAERIEIAWEPAPDLWRVKVDRSQIDHIVTSLIGHARASIANTGRITIATSNVQIDDAFCAEHTAAAPGDFVSLRVTDNGRGMDAATLACIFEPFFSSGADEGGLGLATAYGSVRQNGGFILVESLPELGSTFRVYIPATEEPLAGGSGLHTIAEPTAPQGERTVLLAEDEPAVLELARSVLSQQGYRVHPFRFPVEAVTFLDSHRGPIDLLITDVMMPGMTGRDLAREVERRRPGVAVLYMSGYPADVISEDGVLDPAVAFLQKPFTVATLVRRVAALIRESSNPGA